MSGRPLGAAFRVFDNSRADEFNAEVPEPDDAGPQTWDDEWAAISNAFGGGANELQRDIIAMAGLFMPRAPRDLRQNGNTT